jgi:hypothetical protein
MKWSLFLLFCIVIAILALFKNYDDFKGSRGFRMSGGGRRGPFTLVDAVLIVLLLFWLYIGYK